MSIDLDGAILARLQFASFDEPRVRGSEV